jgi:hypothetical protein
VTGQRAVPSLRSGDFIGGGDAAPERQEVPDIAFNDSEVVCLRDAGNGVPSASCPCVGALTFIWHPIARDR